MNAYSARLAFLILFILVLLCIQASADIKVWYTYSAFKVMRDAKPQRTSKWKLYAAKNEVESC